MQAALFRWLDRLVEIAVSRDPDRQVVEAPRLDMLAVIEQARQEWLNTDHYFDCVSDPELVDHAILLKEAAQKKYMYLLKQARMEGLRAFAPEPLGEALEDVNSPQVQLARELQNDW